jgi:hypothetical protein
MRSVILKSTDPAKYPNPYDELFPRDHNGQTIINNHNIGILGRAIGNYLQKTHAHPVSGYPESPALQNLRQAKKELGSLQNISTTTAFEEHLDNVKKQFSIMETFADNDGYRMIYDMFDPSPDSYWKVETQAFSMSAKRMREGEWLQYGSHSDSSYLVDCYPYASGWALTRHLIRTRKWAKIEKGLKNLRLTMENKKRAVAYALIEGIGAGQNITWQPVPGAIPNTEPTYTAIRDALTITEAANSLYEANRDKIEYAVGGNLMTTPLVLIYPYRLDFRIRTALTLMLNSQNSSELYVNAPIVKVKTDQFVSQAEYYICIPKGKNEGGEMMDIELFNQFNQSNYTEEFASWQWFNFNIGDVEQWQRCLTS